MGNSLLTSITNMQIPVNFVYSYHAFALIPCFRPKIVAMEVNTTQLKVNNLHYT